MGDSVYADYNGHVIILTTENGLPCHPSNEIHLEPEVVDALLRFIKRHTGKFGDCGRYNRVTGCPLEERK